MNLESIQFFPISGSFSVNFTKNRKGLITRISFLICSILANFILPIITARKRSLGQGNIFAPVCHSVHRGGVYPSMHPNQVHPLGSYTSSGRYTAWAGTPPDRYTPPRQVHTSWAGTPPLCRYTPPGQVRPQTGTFLWAGTPPRQVHLPGKYTSPVAGTPLLVRYAPQTGTFLWAGTTPPPSSVCWGDTGNKRAVRILLECILVIILLCDKIP